MGPGISLFVLDTTSRRGDMMVWLAGSNKHEDLKCISFLLFPFITSPRRYEHAVEHLAIEALNHE